MSNDPPLGQNRPVYLPGDVVRAKTDPARMEGVVVLADATYKRALVRWSDPEQAAAPEQWTPFVELEKMRASGAVPQSEGPQPSAVNVVTMPTTYDLSLSEARERRRAVMEGADPVGLMLQQEIPVYGGHPTLSGQPGGQPAAGPNDTQGMRPQMPPNLKEGQPGDGQFLTDLYCSTCTWWESGVESAEDAPGSEMSPEQGACTEYNIDTGSSQVCDSWQGRSGYDMAVVVDEQTPMELLLDEAGQRFRKVALRTGVVAAATPDSSGQMTERPLEFVEGRSVMGSSGLPEKIGFQDIIESIDDPAFERITVPESHLDRPRENAGFVVGYEVKDDPDRPGGKLLELEQEITEPSIAERIQNGSIFGSSVGLIFDYVRKSDLKKFPVALKHNALTNVPWVRGLGSHAVAASEEGVQEADDGLTVGGVPVNRVLRVGGEVYLGEEGQHPLVKAGKALSDGKGGYRWPIRNATDLSNAKHAFGRAKPSEKGKIKAWINKRAGALGLPKMGESGASAAEHLTTEGGDSVGTEQDYEAVETTDPAVQLQLSQQEDVIRQQQLELDKVHADLHRRSVDETVAGWSHKRLDRLPGFLAEARRLMMADDGGPALVMIELSDGNETRTELTATDIVTQLVAALPYDDKGELKLGDQAFAPDPSSPEEGKPAMHMQLDDPQDRNSFDNKEGAVKDRADEVLTELGMGSRVPTGGETA